MDIYNAVRSGDLSLVTTLLNQGIDPNTPRLYQASHYIEAVYPLIEAVQQGNFPMVRLLIEKGAKANVKTRGDGQTPLHAAFLIDAVIPQKLSNAERKACIHEMVKYLVKQGANVNAEGGFCLSPLHLAVYSKNADTVTFLIQHGADVNLFLEYVDENESRTTPLGCAVQENNLEMVKLLIQHGTKPSTSENCCFTPLEEALELGNEDIIQAIKDALD